MIFFFMVNNYNGCYSMMHCIIFTCQSLEMSKETPCDTLDISHKCKNYSLFYQTVYRDRKKNEKQKITKTIFINLSLSSSCNGWQLRNIHFWNDKGSIYRKIGFFCPVASDEVYQLLAHGRWFSPGIPASSTTKTGCHDITESGDKHQKH